MPTITRWFRVTHDINSDPEMWELRETFGDRAGFIWLECLSIADRNNGLIGTDSPQLLKVLATKCRVHPKKVSAVFEWCLKMVWIEFRDGFRIAKWSKYNKTRDAAQRPSETTPNQTRHDVTTKRKRAAVAAISSNAFSESEWPSPEKLVALYNELTPDDCAAVETLSPARRAKAEQYLKIFPKQEFWEQVFDRVYHSRFLRGQQNKNGHGSFHFDFDWMLTKGKDGSENVVKVAEGRYADERK